MTFAQFVASFSWLFNGLIALLATGALALFMLGMARYMFKQSGISGKDNKFNGRDLMLWGLLALFVIFAVGGILNFFAKDIFGLTVHQGGSQMQPPCTGTRC
jgi:hypothetical protein